MKTLSDLIERFQLYAICTDCERMERVSIQHLIEHHGGDFLIESVRQRLRCTSCGVRTGDVRIVYVGEKGKVAGFHYRGTGPSRSNSTDKRSPPETRQPVRSSVDSRVSPKPSTPT